MKLSRLWQSVMVRLLVCVLLAALLASAGFGWLQRQQARQMLRMGIAEHLLARVHGVEDLLASLAPGSGAEGDALALLQQGLPVSAVKLHTPDAERSQGRWQPGTHPAQWRVDLSTFDLEKQISLNRKTVAQSTFLMHGKPCELSFVIDGPAAWQREAGNLWSQLLGQWLMLSLVFLVGTLLFRRLIHEPLAQLKTLLDDGVHAAGLRRFARRQSGEICALAQAAGESLTGWEAAARESNERLHLLESLVEHAPVAMVTVDVSGVVTELNQRAAGMLGAESQGPVVGRRAASLVARQDRPLLKELIERSLSRSSARCRLELAGPGPTRFVIVEAAAKRDADGTPEAIHLVLVDVTQATTYHDETVEYRRVLQAMLDQMPDAMLFVDTDGRVAAFNDALLRLLGARPEQIEGVLYEHETFWNTLEPRDAERFWRQLDGMASQRHQQSEERLETAAGRMLFRCAPVQVAGEGQGQPYGQAHGQAHGQAYVWMVRELSAGGGRETTGVDHASCLKRLNAALIRTTDVDGLLGEAVEQLYRVLEVEAVGVAIRSVSPTGPRTRHRLHRGRALCRLETSHATLRAVERELLPIMVSRTEAMLWPELPAADGWGSAFASAGFTSFAAVGLPGWAGAQGTLWIAQRGGERITRQSISLLESLSPLIAALLHGAAMEDNLRQLRLIDPVTHLPNKHQFEQILRTAAVEFARPFSMVGLRIDGLSDEHDHVPVLNELAAQLRRACRQSSVVARVGERTFAILSPQLDEREAEALATRLGALIDSYRDDPAHLHCPPMTAQRVWATSIDRADVPESLWRTLQDRLNGRPRPQSVA